MSVHKIRGAFYRRAVDRLHLTTGPQPIKRIFAPRQKVIPLSKGAINEAFENLPAGLKRNYKPSYENYPWYDPNITGQLDLRQIARLPGGLTQLQGEERVFKGGMFDTVSLTQYFYKLPDEVTTSFCIVHNPPNSTTDQPIDYYSFYSGIDTSAFIECRAPIGLTEAAFRDKKPAVIILTDTNGQGIHGIEFSENDNLTAPSLAAYENPSEEWQKTIKDTIESIFLNNGLEPVLK
jgi:hypothetical protein